jgi:hypothetical protein
MALCMSAVISIVFYYYGYLLFLFTASIMAAPDIQFVPLSKEFLAMLDDETQYNKRLHVHVHRRHIEL